MIVPCYYEDLSVLHENYNASQSLFYSGIQNEWITWWSTGKSQTECSY